MEYIGRDEAEKIIQDAIEHYIPDDQIQQILDILYENEYQLVDSEIIEEYEE